MNVNKLNNKPANSTSKSKKIDLGAASNFGKSATIDINSPTHRNTHNEELFSPNNNNNTSATKNNLIEDLFSNSPDPSATHEPLSQNDDIDDFNPRSDEVQEFGDFSSAFGNAPATAASAPTITNRPKPPSISAGDDEFADFSSAFTGGNATNNQPQNNANDLLFNSNSTNHTSLTLDNSSFNNQPLNVDLFGGNLNSIPLSTQPTSLGADLLSDFGGLSINASNGEFVNFYLIINLSFLTSLHSMLYIKYDLYIKSNRLEILYAN